MNANRQIEYKRWVNLRHHDVAIEIIDDSGAEIIGRRFGSRVFKNCIDAERFLNDSNYIETPPS